MRTLLLSTVAFAALAGTAFAADLPSRKEAPVYVAPAPVFSWTGFYIGADIGGDFGSTSTHWLGTNWNSHSLNTSGVLGGGYIGYNYQLNNSIFGGSLLLGVEGDFQGTSNNASFTFVDPSFSNAWTIKTQQNWLASANGRIGVTYDRALFYAIGGAAWAQGNVSASVVSPANAFVGTVGTNKDLTGWDVGGGVEYAFTPNWLGRVEYRYYDFNNFTIGNGTFAGFNPFRENTTINTVRVGLAYLFSAPAPVVAKY
jgi:outer membrane immunogenic protein